MAENNSAVESDAILTENHNSEDQLNLQCTEDTYRIIKSRLLEDDLWKLKILLLSNTPKNKVMSIHNVEDFFQESNSDYLLAEMLFIIKRFDLLKHMGVCKHHCLKYFQNNSKLSPKWICFYQALESADLHQSEDVIQKFFSQEDTSFNQEIFSWFQLNKTESRTQSEDHYELKHTPCGYCLIINNEKFESDDKNRRGSNIDRDKLKNLFESFDFHVDVKDNLTSKKIKTIMKSISKDLDDNTYDAFVCFILSHGNEGVIYGIDEKRSAVYLQDDIIGLFSEESSKFHGKPKMFFIQACQGEKYLTLESDSYQEFPPHCLLSLATIPGFRSWRDTNSGTWYINILVEHLKELGCKTDIKDVLTKVHSDVSKCATKKLVEEMPHLVGQRPIFKTTMEKKFKFKLKRLSSII